MPDGTSTQNTFKSKSGSEESNSDYVSIESSLVNDVCWNCLWITQMGIFELTCYSVKLSEHSPDNVRMTKKLSYIHKNDIRGEPYILL